MADVTCVSLEGLCGLSILVVDDELDARELMAVVLEGAGATVYVAEAVDAALAALALHSPDLIISDIAMPDEDGYSLIRRVRLLEHERTRAIPAIALTAFGTADDRARAIGAGFDDHLVKPQRPAVLVDVIRRLSLQRQPS